MICKIICNYRYRLQGEAQQETLIGSNKSVATSVKYYKTVSQIKMDNGGNTADNIKAGIK